MTRSRVQTGLYRDSTAVADRPVKRSPQLATRPPVLVTGDGLAGYDKNAEYDRLIATCSVRYVPMPWMWQVRDGGTITAPLTGWMRGAAFAHLTLGDDGTASGRFLKDDIYFMTARTHGPPPVASPYLRSGEVRESRVDPRVLDSPAGLSWHSSPRRRRCGWAVTTRSSCGMSPPVRAGAGIAVFTIAFGHWTGQTGQKDLLQFIGESFAGLKAVTAGT
ncbi:hypothetical protein AB0B89_28190 [Sphaerisporangium sp. NPDC049002]|uniref:hypothetical protein n=1 Tax=Sphaerisporangium sp. NPDC049002 TaxID=3155392 RepID=UPI0033C291EC